MEKGLEPVYNLHVAYSQLVYTTLQDIYRLTNN